MHRLIARPRRARLEDAPAIAAAHLAAWAENYGGLMPAEMLAAHDLDSRTQLWRHLIGTPAAPACAIYVVEDGSGGVIGFAACGPQRDKTLAALGFRGEFWAVYVLRAGRGRGLGRQLIGACARRLLAHDMPAAAIRLLAGHAEGRRWCRALAGEEIALPGPSSFPDGLPNIAYGWRNILGLALG
ncbi:MAG: GNAT family N-acetyltransferase [Rhodovarius sp.]|nr:GNAT family N-acetyltransferase [Rhodovarius sp.]